MDDIQVIIYIAFVLFAIISRALKKKKAVAKKPVQSNNQDPEQSSPSPLSFEELLREFTEEKTETVEPDPEPSITRERERVYDRQDDEEVKRVYEESVRASKRFELESKHTDDRHTGNFTHFRGYSEEDTEEEENEYADLFRDPESAKRAIIASEILIRKY